MFETLRNYIADRYTKLKEAITTQNNDFSASIQRAWLVIREDIQKLLLLVLYIALFPIIISIQSLYSLLTYESIDKDPERWWWTRVLDELCALFLCLLALVPITLITLIFYAIILLNIPFFANFSTLLYAIIVMLLVVLSLFILALIALISQDSQ